MLFMRHNYGDTLSGTEVFKLGILMNNYYYTA